MVQCDRNMSLLLTPMETDRTYRLSSPTTLSNKTTSHCFRSFGTECTAHELGRVSLQYKYTGLYDYVIFICLKYIPIKFIAKILASVFVGKFLSCLRAPPVLSFVSKQRLHCRYVVKALPNYFIIFYPINPQTQ